MRRSFVERNTHRWETAVGNCANEVEAAARTSLEGTQDRQGAEKE